MTDPTVMKSEEHDQTVKPVIKESTNDNKDRYNESTKESSSENDVSAGKLESTNPSTIPTGNENCESCDQEQLQKAVDLDVRYMSLENEYLEEWAKLQEKFEDKQSGLIVERKEIVEKGGLGPHFWLKVLQSHPIFRDEIHETDIPVLELLQNIRCEHLPDPSNKRRAGFSVIFDFGGKTNADKLPFTNDNGELIRVFETGLESEYLTEVGVQNIYMKEEIQWKDGKNCTVKVTKSGKNGKNTKEEEIPSFFRTFFRTIDIEDPEKVQDLLDKGLQEMGIDQEDLEDEEDLEQAYEDALAKVTDDAYEMALCLRDNIVPFAIRWFTGQAYPMDDDMELEGSEGEGDDDDDEHDEDEEGSDEEGGEDDDGEPKIGKSKKEKSGKKGDKKKEECKQQ